MFVYITIIVPNSLRLLAIFSFYSYMGMTETILEDLSSLIIMYICLMLEQYPCQTHWLTRIIFIWVIFS